MKKFHLITIDEIDSEKIAVIAEKGLKAVNLSKKEKSALLYSHMDELYRIKNFLSKEIAPLEDAEVEILMREFSFQKERRNIRFSNLLIKLHEDLIDLVSLPEGWCIGSAQFAHRSTGNSEISLHKKIGALTIHLEIKRKPDKCADLNVLISDESSREPSMFEVSLFKGERCLETAGVVKNKKATLSKIQLGNYELHISDQNGEVTSLSITMED